MDTSRRLLAIEGHLGVLAGMLLLLRPDGSWVHMQITWLHKTPVNTYVLPGIVIGIGFGIIPLLLTKQKYYTRRNVLGYALLALAWLLFEAVFLTCFAGCKQLCHFYLLA